jgi:hypothetical protein
MDFPHTASPLGVAEPRQRIDVADEPGLPRRMKSMGGT